MDGEPRPLTIGKAELLREGSDVVIWTYGPWAGQALLAADTLAAEGIDAGVVNARWVKPLDADLLVRTATATGAVVTVEEGALAGGFGSAVLETLAERALADVRVHRIGVPDLLVPHGDPKHFHPQFGLSVDGIAAAARTLALQARAEVAPRRGQRRRPAEKRTRGLGAAAAGHAED